jgi:hypothetical protein
VIAQEHTFAFPWQVTVSARGQAQVAPSIAVQSQFTSTSSPW